MLVGSLMHAVVRPGPPLDVFVDFFWSSDGYVSTSERERILPTGAQSLVVHLGDGPVRVFRGEDAPMADDVSSSVLCGARSSPLIIAPAAGPTVGVFFKPGGARPFFDVAAESLAGAVAPLEALWGRSAAELRERLLETSSQELRAKILEVMLRARLGGALDGPSPAVRAAFAAFEEGTLTSVSEVNERIGLSPKRLLALFRDQVGLGPKAFWRVRRFRAALRDLDAGRTRGATIAADHGYFDQAHFLREFRVLAGSSPRVYLASRVLGTDHVAVGTTRG